MLWHKLPKSIYFRRGSLPIALDEVITDGHKRALIVTDRFLFNNGYPPACRTRADVLAGVGPHARPTPLGKPGGLSKAKT